MSHRILAAEVMRKTFKFSWKIESGLQVELLEKNMFTFQFLNKDDRICVLNQGPWLFDKFLLVLEFPIRAQKSSDYSFSFAAFWIHFLDLPLDWYNTEMAERLSNAVGEYEDVDSINGFHFWGASLRVRV